MWRHQAKVVTWVYVICCESVQSADALMRQIADFRCKPRTHKWPLLLGGSINVHINRYHNWYACNKASEDLKTLDLTFNDLIWPLFAFSSSESCSLAPIMARNTCHTHILWCHISTIWQILQNGVHLGFQPPQHFPQWGRSLKVDFRKEKCQKEIKTFD